MTREVTFRVEIPDGVNDADAREWLRFQLGELGGCSLKNPLVDEELEAEFGSVELD